MSSNSCCSFNSCQYFLCKKTSICEATWYKIVGISRSTYLFYKHDNKCGTRQRLRGNVGMKKQVAIRQPESNVQSLINQCAEVTPHQ